MPEIPEELQNHTVMEWGKTEEFAKQSPKVARELYPEAEIIVREGFNHCEYMIKQNADYVAAIEKLAGEAG